MYKNRKYIFYLSTILQHFRLSYFIINDDTHIIIFNIEIRFIKNEFVNIFNASKSIHIYSYNFVK